MDRETIKAAAVATDKKRMQWQLVKQRYTVEKMNGVFIDLIRPYLYLSYSILIESLPTSRQMAFTTHTFTTFVVFIYLFMEAVLQKGQHFHRPIKLYIFNKSTKKTMETLRFAFKMLIS